jgi:glycosyltransferase involved in cell wall biosynthesis
MKIWILSHYATLPDNPGITRHFDFAKELVKQGHHVTIFASSFGHRTRKEERLQSRQNHLIKEIDGIEFIWVRTFPYQRNNWRRVVNMLSYSYRVILLGLRLKERPDIILASSPHPFAGLSAYILSRRKKAEFIFEVRDLWPQVLVEIGSYSEKSLVVRLMRLLEKFLYQKARSIVVVPPEAAKYITQLDIPSEKIVHIPNGVSTELFASALELPQKLDELISSLKSGGRVLVGYAGAHGIGDTLDTVLEMGVIFRRDGVDNVRLLLVGDGAEKPRLLAKAKELDLDNVSFFEAVPKYVVPALLRTFDIAIIPRKKSGMGEYGVSKNKLFDCMASARPIVWGSNSVNDPVAEADCGISVAPEDAEQMAKAILELNSLSESKRREMGKRGYEYVMKYHSIPVLADRLLKVIEEARGSSNRAGDPGK